MTSRSQRAVVDLLPGVAADVPQLLLCDVFHGADDVWQGHGARAAASGRVIFLRKKESLQSPDLDL